MWSKGLISNKWVTFVDIHEFGFQKSCFHVSFCTCTWFVVILAFDRPPERRSRGLSPTGQSHAASLTAFGKLIGGYFCGFGEGYGAQASWKLGVELLGSSCFRGFSTQKIMASLEIMRFRFSSISGGLFAEQELPLVTIWDVQWTFYSFPKFHTFNCIQMLVSNNIL